MDQRAFTLVELLMVIAIVALIAVLSVPMYYSYYGRQQLSSVTAEIVQNLRRAQTKAQGVEDNQMHGIHFETDRYILFADVYTTEGGSEKEIFILPDTVTITGINLNGGGHDVTFEKLTGETDDFGTVTLNGQGQEKIISISSLGAIDVL